MAAFAFVVAGTRSIVWTATTLGFMTGGSLFGGIGLGVNKPPDPEPHSIFYQFRLGLDGSGVKEGYDPLAGSGGHLPRVRVYDKHEKLLGMSKDVIGCEDGEDNCWARVKHIKKQPANALLSGEKDAVCIASVTVQYLSGDKYGWVGNWAHSCHQPWYFSDIDARHENGTVKLLCAWLGSEGYKSGFPTGIRINFPEFVDGFAGNNNTADYYCDENNSALAFYHNKRPVFLNGDNDMEHKVKEQEKKKYGKPPAKRSVGMEAKSIVSHYAGHSAKILCNSPNSVGPSLVSLSERAFCHMPEKTIYAFCDDLTSGPCWDHEAHGFDAKGAAAVHARAALPDVRFGKPLVWGK